MGILLSKQCYPADWKSLSDYGHRMCMNNWLVEQVPNVVIHVSYNQISLLLGLGGGGESDSRSKYQSFAVLIILKINKHNIII